MLGRRSRYIPITQWLPKYRAAWLRDDIVAGITLAAYAIPVSRLCRTGGITASGRHLRLPVGRLALRGFWLLTPAAAIGPTIGDFPHDCRNGGGDGGWRRPTLCADCKPCGVHRGRPLTACLGLAPERAGTADQQQHSSGVQGRSRFGDRHDATAKPPRRRGWWAQFFERAALLVDQIGNTQGIVLAIGVVAILLLVLGDRLLPGKPVALGVVVLAIVAAQLLALPSLGVPTTGAIPAGLPSLGAPVLRIRDVEGIVPLAAGCLLLAYIEGISAARTFAAKHGYTVDSRQEF